LNAGALLLLLLLLLAAVPLRDTIGSSHASGRFLSPEDSLFVATGGGASGCCRLSRV